MSILVSLQHVTRYRYERPVSIGPQIVRLRPAPHCRTRIASYALKVAPVNHFVNWQQDPQGNWIARFIFPERSDALTFEVGLTAELAVINPFDFFIEPYAEQFPFAYPEELRGDLTPYLVAEPAGPLLSALVEKAARLRTNTVEFLVGLNADLQRSVGYEIRMSPGVQAPEDTLM
ncbi:MAG TPA: transglutaminase N-terminal domain-containing protein, partial [Roseiarcus sp.]|nr:transglutaminase N-terminal domain-containing protein [Roseiarcus sp.]